MRAPALWAPRPERKATARACEKAPWTPAVHDAGDPRERIRLTGCLWCLFPLALPAFVWVGRLPDGEPLPHTIPGGTFSFSRRGPDAQPERPHEARLPEGYIRRAQKAPLMCRA